MALQNVVRSSLKKQIDMNNAFYTNILARLDEVEEFLELEYINNLVTNIDTLQHKLGHKIDNALQKKTDQGESVSKLVYSMNNSVASIKALQSRLDKKIQSVLQKQEKQDKSNIYLKLGYRQIGLKYYYFNHYMTFDWINAVGFCRLMKGDLVTFESAIELSNVQHGMYFSYSNMWIGFK